MDTLTKQTPQEIHQARHVELHKNLDELVADFISQTGGLPSQTPLMDFMKWAYEQTVNPTEKVG